MPSSKEQEVLEQQRRLALSLKQKQLKQQQEQKVAQAKKNAKKPTTEPKPASATATAAPAAAAALKRPTSHKPATLKRPSVHQRNSTQSLKRPATASAVLAAARERAARGSTADDATAGGGETVDLTTTSTDVATGTGATTAVKGRKVLTTSSSNTADLSSFTTSTESVASLPKLTKKTGKAPSAFSSLVQTAKSSSNAAAGAGADDISSTTLPNVDPDDFWKHLRDWDFCQQVHLQLEQQKQPNKIKQQQDQQENVEDPDAPVAKTLPDTFLSPRHYVAAWAPLCLAETRAQILSDWLSDVGSGRIQRSGASVTAIMTDNRGPVRRGPGIIHPRNDPYHSMNMMRLEPEDSVCLRLVCKGGGGGGGGDLSFVTNDIVLLVPIKFKDLFIGVLNGKYKPTPDEALSDNPFKKWGIVVGHTKCTRKTPHDLIVEVSKRKWALVPTLTGTHDNKRGEEAELWLWKLGSNVTALREFTALCRMDLLPLKRFLLGQHLDPHLHDAKKPTQLQILDKNGNDSKADLLDKMGGTQALGKGFISYAKQKFNPSQLLAIAASAHEYGEGGFTLIKGPPGTGKTTTLVAVLNSLHIRQYNKYYEQVRQIAKEKKNRQFALELARKSKPRLLVCAPSNTAVDNIILKIMEDGFVDGQGKRYNPSMIRIGVGQSGAIRRAVSLEQKVDAIFTEYQDLTKLDGTMERHRTELQNLNAEITKCRRRIHAIEDASPWPLSKGWEIRVDEENFDADFEAGGGGRVYFVNHHEKMTTFQVPPPPEPGEQQFSATAMPEYRALMASIVKLVEQCFTIKTELERCTIVKGSIENGANHMQVRTTLELHVLNSVHMIMTTLGTAGGRTLEGVDKFEVVVIDEAAQSVEPATLAALQLGSRHCVLVGDPQQLPATIFNVSGKTTKYDRSLFQRLEEASQPVYMLDEQYRMHPKISHFPRHIFYGGTLRDGPNVLKPDYGNPVRDILSRQMPLLQPFTILDLDSKEERGGTSLSNSQEAQLAVHLYNSLNDMTGGLLQQSKVAIITPYAQQTKLLSRSFENALGPRYENFVEVNTVDAYQGREANVVIFSAVRAAGSRGIGFLSDVRRMNVALTRAKHFLLVIARCKSIVVNPYWNDLVQHARENQAVLRVPIHQQGQRNLPAFGNAKDWQLEDAARPYMDNAPMMITGGENNVDAALSDLASLQSGKPADPRRNNKNRNARGPSNQSNNVDASLEAALADLSALQGTAKPIDPRRGNQSNGNHTKQKRHDPRRPVNRPQQGYSNNGNNDRPRGTNPEFNYSNESIPGNISGDPTIPIPPPPPPPPPPNHVRGYNAPIGVPPPPPPPPRIPPPPPPPPRAVDPRDPRKRGY